jgi:hypothetical protein
MTIARTLTLPASGNAYLQWQSATPSDALDYAIDATAAIQGDLIASLSVAIAPSGAGELTVSAASAILNVVSFTLSGGTAGRLYAVRLDVVTELGRTFSWLAYLPVTDATATNVPPPPAPVADFGTPATWAYSGPVRPLPAVSSPPTVTYPADFSNRTLIIDPSGSQYLQWPIAQPNDALDYYLDATAIIGTDAITAVFVAAKPSGYGELVIGSPSYLGGVVTVNLSNGAAGRVYSVRIDISTVSGRSFSYVVILPIDMLYQSGPPPNPGFGPSSQYALIVLENSLGVWELESNAGAWVWG